jgi:hypothetical protein
MCTGVSICTTGDVTCPATTTCVQGGSFYTCQCASGYTQNGWNATVPYYAICVPSQDEGSSNQTLVIALCVSAGCIVLIVAVVLAVVLTLRRKKRLNLQQNTLRNAAGTDKIEEFGDENRAATFADDQNRAAVPIDQAEAATGQGEQVEAAAGQGENVQPSSAEQLPGGQACTMLNDTSVNVEQ